MNNDLISRNALKKDFKERLAKCDEWIEKAKDKETRIRASTVKAFIAEVIMTIDNAPTVETKTTYDVNRAYDRGYITAMNAYARPKGDLISRQEAIDVLEEQLDYLRSLNKNENPTAEGKWYGVNWARNTIADLPYKQNERPKGEWLRVNNKSNTGCWYKKDIKGKVYRNEHCDRAGKCIDYIGYHCTGCNSADMRGDTK